MFPRDLSSGPVLRSPWAGLLGAGWIAIGVALVGVGATSRQIGKPAWWLGGGTGTSPSIWWLVPLIGPLLAALASRAPARWALAVSLLASLGLVAIASGDAASRTGAAVAQFVLAGAGLLLTAASAAGRPTRRLARPTR